MTHAISTEGIFHVIGRPISSSPRENCVAIIGSRNATQYGLMVAGFLGAQAAMAGLVVVSGAALGVDITAQRGAMSRGGRTMAVLPCGVDCDYPQQNAGTIEAMRAEHTVVSAFPPGTRPNRDRFLTRNGHIMQLCTNAIVVEGAHQSGTENAVRQAMEMGIILWAVPGPITSPQSLLPNLLIQQGNARLITDMSDIRP